MLAERGRIQEAIPYFDKALELDPKDADTQNNIAAALVRAGRAEAALPFLEKALAADPDAPELHGNMGLILARQGRFDEAMPHLEKALAAGFDSIEAHRALGRGLAGQGRFAEAIPHFEVVAKSGDPIALGALSSVYASVGRMQDALRVARQGLAVATERNDRDLIQALKDSISLYEKGAGEAPR
jgi:tetratricopeptide (TPR) repeat protein